MTILGLFTSRVILQTLGVTDYGVYSAVGGVISMMGLLTKSLSKSISRFLTFELGRGDMKRLKEVFEKNNVCPPHSIEKTAGACIELFGSANSGKAERQIQISTRQTNSKPLQSSLFFDRNINSRYQLPARFEQSSDKRLL